MDLGARRWPSGATMPGRLPGQSVRLGRVHVLAEDLVDVPEELGQAENKISRRDKKIGFCF